MGRSVMTAELEGKQVSMNTQLAKLNLFQGASGVKAAETPPFTERFIYLQFLKEYRRTR
ncbi:hypothetical protein GQS_03770 [Thermococcus sp. 4557]|nr:hypothetical protein GQS_03770 [Thermococcus sp. 4557]